jgi:DNA invertase Pin-like site-specific DNA recombinase
MIYGYARVSTLGQAKDGNSLNDQIQKLEKEGAKEIIEEYYTGTTTDRPKFSELISRLQGGDTLIVTKLDRFARSVGQGVTLIQDLIDRGVTVKVLNIGTMSNNPTDKLLMNIMLAFAQFERDMIVERTQEGKRIAKQRDGFEEGRPRISKKKTDYAMELLDNGMSYKEVSEKLGISKSTLVRRRREWKVLESSII